MTDTTTSQTRSLFVPDSLLAGLAGVGVYLYDPEQRTTTPQSDFKPSGRAFQFYEVSIVAGSGSWWTPTVRESVAPDDWPQPVVALAASGDGIWTQEGEASVVRPQNLFWWTPEATLATMPLRPGINRGAVSGAAPNLAPLTNSG